MNTKAIAQALSTLSLAIGELAEALDQPAVSPPAGEAVAGKAVLPAADEYEELDDDGFGQPAREPAAFGPPVAAREYGSEAICPAHHKPFKEGKFGLFCPEKGIEPRWTNTRGYCQITPKNVAAYLRQHAAVPA